MKKVVWLRTYRGTEILRRENGELKNENNLVKLTHNTMEWNNFLKHMRGNALLCKVEVEKVFQPKVVDGKTLYDEVNEFEDIKKEVKLAYFGDNENKLTPEQERIAKLEAQLEKLLGGSSKKVKEIEVKEEVVVSNNDLESLQSAYSTKFEGKDVPARFKNDAEWIKNKLNQ